jgi:Fe-S-cluster containining protein
MRKKGPALGAVFRRTGQFDGTSPHGHAPRSAARRRTTAACVRGRVGQRKRQRNAASGLCVRLVARRLLRLYTKETKETKKQHKSAEFNRIQQKSTGAFVFLMLLALLHGALIRAAVEAVGAVAPCARALRVWHTHIHVDTTRSSTREYSRELESGECTRILRSNAGSCVFLESRRQQCTISPLESCCCRYYRRTFHGIRLKTGPGQDTSKRTSRTAAHGIH